MQKLNENQILELFEYTKYCGVEYVDIQHELVDHLATDIEQQMIHDRSYYEKNKAEILKSYFHDILNISKRKEGQVNRDWNRKILMAMKKNFSIKFLLGVILISIMIVFIVKHIYLHTLFIFFCVAIISAIISFYHFVEHTNDKLYDKNNFLFYKVIHRKVTEYFIPTICFAPAYSYLWFSNPALQNSVFEHNVILVTLSILVVLSISLSYFIYSHIPQLLNQEIDKNYNYLKRKKY